VLTEQVCRTHGADASRPDSVCRTDGADRAKCAGHTVLTCRVLIRSAGHTVLTGQDRDHYLVMVAAFPAILLQHLQAPPYNPHPTPYTLHPTPYTLHPTPYTPHPTQPRPAFQRIWHIQDSQGQILAVSFR